MITSQQFAGTERSEHADWPDGWFVRKRDGQAAAPTLCPTETKGGASCTHCR